MHPVWFMLPIERCPTGHFIQYSGHHSDLKRTRGIGAAGIPRPASRNPLIRHPARKGVTKSRVVAPVADEQLTLALSRIPVQAVAQLRGFDIPEEPDVEDDNDVLASVPQLWAQFASDLVQKLGNPRDACSSSYSHLDRPKRERLTNEVMKTRYLGEVFSQVQWVLATKEQWGKSFRLLWPPVGCKASPLSAHYYSMKYYTRWISLMERVSATDAQLIRNEVQILFNELTWAPAAICDRVWDFKTKNRGSDAFAKLPIGVVGGPKIYINHRYRDTIPVLLPIPGSAIDRARVGRGTQHAQRKRRRRVQTDKALILVYY
ncbi:hypothetical protein BD779DRAFT_1675600 [Infundibulicybe gibba]|nr:hypothetical protein BD779DRAFT_1675600 [Infundibulicybe gibba]